MAEQIEVVSNPVPAQIMSLVRDGLKALGAYLATTGVVGASTWEIVTGVVIFAIPVLWSQFVVRAKKKELVAAAQASNRDVTVV